MSRPKGNLPQPTGQPDSQFMEERVSGRRAIHGPFLSAAFAFGFAPVVRTFLSDASDFARTRPGSGGHDLQLPIMPPYHPSATKERPLGGLSLRTASERRGRVFNSIARNQCDHGTWDHETWDRPARLLGGNL